MTHDAIREIYPQVRQIVEENNTFTLYDADKNVLDLDLSVVPSQTVKELTATYKGYYSNVVNNKLSELDYDNISTVSVWVSDSTFGTEATNILTWYKAIIAFNYQMINDIKAGIKAVPTKDEYLAQLPQYQG